MTFSAFCGLAAGLIFAVSAGWYVLDVAKGKVTASVATFFMFTVINISQLASLISEHVWHVIPFTVVGLISSATICVLALRNKKIYFQLPDKIGLAGALLGFMVWLFTKNAALNIYIISLVNLLTFTPLIIKSSQHPDLETTSPWRINLLASSFLLLGVNSAAAVVWVVPARQFLCSFLLNVGLWRGSLKDRHTASGSHSK